MPNEITALEILRSLLQESKSARSRYENELVRFATKTGITPEEAEVLLAVYLRHAVDEEDAAAIESLKEKHLVYTNTHGIVEIDPLSFPELAIWFEERKPLRIY